MVQIIDKEEAVIPDRTYYGNFFNRFFQGCYVANKCNCSNVRNERKLAERSEWQKLQQVTNAKTTMAKPPQVVRKEEKDGRLNVATVQGSYYSPSTLIANWSEDLRALEIRLEEFQRKQRKSDLKVNRTRRTFYNLFQTRAFIQKGKYVKYGQTVQIVTPDTPAPDSNLGLTLCGTVTEADIDKYEHFSTQSLVNASPVRQPYVKNLFKLLPCQGSLLEEGDDLKFGDEFLLSTTGSWNGRPLYVKSDPPRAMCPGNALNHGVVTFSSKEDRYCRWKVCLLANIGELFCDNFAVWDESNLPEKIIQSPRWKAIYMQREEREAMDMHPIEPETRMLIRQVMTNKSLSAEPSLWYQTFFGPEAEVSVHDYLTPKRTDSVHSIWYFVTQDKTDVPTQGAEDNVNDAGKG